jgi:uncharacterized protein
MVSARLFFLPAVLLTICAAVSRGSEPSDEDTKNIAFLCAHYMTALDTVPSEKKTFLPEHEVSILRMFSCFTISLYQSLISSQQYNVCVFTPSCSHFGMAAVQRFGFLKGVLLTSDRLQRCNLFAPQNGYGFDPVTGKLYDPVESYIPEAVPRPAAGSGGGKGL